MQHHRVCVMGPWQRQMNNEYVALLDTAINARGWVPEAYSHGVCERDAQG